MSDDELIVSPEVAKLKEECDLLRDELAKLLAEREHLVGTVAPNILAEYVTSIGIKEYEALGLDVQVRQLKATIQKIQAVENQGKKPNLEQIEAAVAEELQEWQKKIDEVAGEIQDSQARLKNQMSSEDSAELQKLYRSLVKKLHPDLNPDLTEKHKLLWEKVQQAYATGDLKEMQALALIADDVPDDIEATNQLESLHKRHEELKTQARELMQQISGLKSTPPLSLAGNLDDPEWVKGQIMECEQRIEALAAEKENLEEWMSLWKGKK